MGAQRLPISELNNLIRSNDIIRVESYSSEHIMQTKYWADQQTKSHNYRMFIRLYEWSCDQLGIAQENRAITWSEFDRWKKQMTLYYEQDQNAQAIKEGFSPDKI